MFNPNPAFLSVEISTQGLYTRSQGSNRKKTLFNLPQVTNKCWTFDGLVLAPKAEKRIQSNLEGQFATLGANVSAFINNFGPICNPRNAQSRPQVFWALTPSVKQALKGVSKSQFEIFHVKYNHQRGSLQKLKKGLKVSGGFTLATYFTKNEGMLDIKCIMLFFIENVMVHFF